jgi:prepilin-type N-terminal cleavage/methylation domain-containing protein
MKRNPAQRVLRGFTLVEVMLGMALVGLLTGAIFAVQRGALTVSTEIAEREAKTMRVHAFCELLRRTFEQAPGNSRVNLQAYGGGGSDLTEVAFTDYPLAFNWPGITAGSKTVIFRTERGASGLGQQASVLYLDEEQSQLWQQGQFEESKVLGRLTLLDGIAFLGWRFFNDTTQEWELEWPLTTTRRPSFVEMTLQFIDGYDPVRLVFWIPTMANPQAFTTGLGGGGGAGAGVPGGGIPGGPAAGGPGGGGRPGAGGGGRGDGGRGPGMGGGGRGGPPGGGGGGRGGPPGGGGGR